MSSNAFPHHRQAALALLNQCPDLQHKAAGFLGHVSIAPVLSDRQHRWLVKLLERHSLTILEGDGLPRLRKYRAYPGGDAQDGDFGSGGSPVAQTGDGRSSESPAALTAILVELPKCPANALRREQGR